MTDRSRNLRPRKPFPYLPPDTQDPDQFGYQRIHFNKDISSPAMELNTHAKTLVKFLNTINKAAREYQPIEKSRGENEVHGQVLMEKIQLKQKNVHERNGKFTQLKEDTNKKTKQPSYFKGQNYQNDIGKVKKPETHKNNKQPYNLVHQFGQYAAIINQMNPRGVHLDSNAIRNFLEVFPQNQLEAASKASIQQQLLMNYGQFGDLKPKTNTSTRNEREQSSKEKDSKLFGRSAYHVAIAYHIHLKKIKQTGQEMINPTNLDPTFHARRLRGDQLNGQR